MNAQLISARVRVPGTATDYISEFTPVAGAEVIAWVRVSTKAQRGHLKDQAADIRDKLARQGIAVAKAYLVVGSGGDPILLATAAAMARQLGLPLVAATTDRFIRNRLDWRRPPTVSDFERLKHATEGVNLYTLAAPDAEPEENMACHVKRGQQQSGKLGGKPKVNPPGYKKARREAALRTVQDYHREALPIRQIAKLTGIPLSTIHRWVGRKS